MRTKSLRELQQKGEKALSGEGPLLLTSRRGVVGILLPVDDENVLHVQQDVQRLVAMQSLRRSWSRARKLGLDRMTGDDIDREIERHRRSSRRRRAR